MYVTPPGASPSVALSFDDSASKPTAPTGESPTSIPAGKSALSEAALKKAADRAARASKQGSSTVTSEVRGGVPAGMLVYVEPGDDDDSESESSDEDLDL